MHAPIAAKSTLRIEILDFLFITLKLFTFQRCASAPTSLQLLQARHAAATASGDLVNPKIRSKISTATVLHMV
jgi:hypothetical protein